MYDDAVSKPKRFWNCVQRNSREHSKINTLVNSDGTVCTEDLDKSELLNNYFKSCFNDKHMDKTDIQISTTEVHKQLKTLYTSKAGGPDGIPPRLLKAATKELSPSLTKLFNMSLETGVLPSYWTDANIVPIHKKGPKKDPANYRPISLTSAVCKILERLICHRIRHHLEINNLLSVNQHGFRERRSCESQIIQVVHDIITSLDSKCTVDIMYFDFSPAFDVVPHSFLIQKLKKYGIMGKILKWIKSFLLKRRQRVNVNGVSSSWCSVASGVPQGTITSPLSFLVYINSNI